MASKRSLNSVSHLHRASAIIAEARSTLESTAIVSARSAFLRRSLTSQLRTLESVHTQLASLVTQGQSDFSALIKDLDEIDGRLEATIDGLKSTAVEQAFRPDDGLQRTLLDFVDEKPVEEIREDLRAAIDGLNGAMKALDDEAHQLADAISEVKQALSGKSSETEDGSTAAFKTKDLSLTIALHSMEDHAKEMALGLESLVKHFDLCVTAIKHTEGGGAAAQKITVDMPEGLGVEDRNFEGPTHTITEDERADMLTVLHNDASEVDDVVIEIQDRVGEMELQLDQMLSWKQRHTAASSEIHRAFQQLEVIGAELPSYISRAQSFQLTWSEERARVDEGMAGLEDLRDVYDNFLAAYDGLIVEVARRRAVKSNMDKVIHDTHAQLDKLFEDDMAHREAFRQNQGDYLPSDIWPGLADPPVRYAFGRTDDSGGSIPDLPRKTIEDAYRRLRGSQHGRS